MEALSTLGKYSVQLNLFALSSLMWDKESIFSAWMEINRVDFSNNVIWFGKAIYVAPQNPI